MKESVMFFGSVSPPVAPNSTEVRSVMSPNLCQCVGTEPGNPPTDDLTPRLCGIISVAATHTHCQSTNVDRIYAHMQAHLHFCLLNSLLTRCSMQNV